MATAGAPARSEPASEPASDGERRRGAPATAHPATPATRLGGLPGSAVPERPRRDRTASARRRRHGHDGAAADVLMLARAIGELVLDPRQQAAATCSTSPAPRSSRCSPECCSAMFAARRPGPAWTAARSRRRSAARCPAIAGILLIVAAGGGFKQMLVDAGVGDVVGDAAEDAQPLRAGAGLAGRGRHPARDRVGHGRHDHRGRHRGPARAAASDSQRAWRCWRWPSARGSLFFSHVNDAGFWLVKEYFGMTVGQTHQDLVGDGDDHLGVSASCSSCC